MTIITLTLNPAFDLHCFAKNFKPYHESIAEVLSRDAGGKGINISRALTSNGYENLALVLVGSENGEEFERGLLKDGLNFLAVKTEGRIRENLTLHEEENPETRISFEGFGCKDDVLSEIAKEIDSSINNSIITFTGSVPKGITKDSIKTFLKELKRKGAKLVIDSRSLTLEDIFEIKPWLIKPNKDEAEAYTGIAIENVDTAKKIAFDIHSKGVENVMLSLGEDGAVLACSEGVFHKNAPKVEVRSTIGAGDSMIAGFISASADGKTKEERLALSIAFGSSACMEEGTRPPRRENIKELYKIIK